VISPAYRSLAAAIDWITPPVAASHPLDDGRAVGLFNTVEETAAQFNGGDGDEWTRLVGPIARDLDTVVGTFLAGRIIPNPFSRAPG
jgi:phytoene dehydrogenase-like protein